MCGIIGYIGPEPALPFLLDGLKRLEYRGYDSAGVAVLEADGFHWDKLPGKLQGLVDSVAGKPFVGTLGIGHTRWATHGPPTRENAHPHFSCNHRIALIHNGIVENHDELRSRLKAKGHVFRSETDTEVVVHLMEDEWKGDPLAAVRAAVAQIRGSYSIVAAFQDAPDVIIGTKMHNPLVVGLDRGRNFLASDVPAVLPYTRSILYLDDGDLAILRRDHVEVVGPDGQPRPKHPQTIDWDLAAAEKEGYPHFMLKEIHEQPKAVGATLAGRITESSDVRFKDLAIPGRVLKRMQRAVIIACGTAWHAGLVAKYAIEELARLPVEVCLSSEFRYGDPALDERTLVIAITQSGETADTLAGVMHAKACGATVLTICNVVGSSITRASDGVIYTHAGPEIGVASTKAYTTQLMALSLLAIHLARLRDATPHERLVNLLAEAQTLPGKVKRTLETDGEVRKVVQRFRTAFNFMYIGRRYNFPNAYEGALKLKEISYIHAEGYGGGEMKHGPLALIDSTFPTVAIAVQGKVYDKMLSNMQEIRARYGLLIAIATEGDHHIRSLAEMVIEVPHTEEMFSPILTVVPLQLLAYHMAVARGCDVDMPRNLAKSVTVE